MSLFQKGFGFWVSGSGRNRVPLFPRVIGFRVAHSLKGFRVFGFWDLAGTGFPYCSKGFRV